MAGLAIWALIFRTKGSVEVAGHAFFHLAIALVLAVLVWRIHRPSSPANRWLWRGGWGVSGAQTLEALGAFGYDDAATREVPGLHFVHNSVAPAVLLAMLGVVVVATIVVLATKLPKPIGVIVASVIGLGGLFFVKTLFGY